MYAPLPLFKTLAQLFPGANMISMALERNVKEWGETKIEEFDDCYLIKNEGKMLPAKKLWIE